MKYCKFCGNELHDTEKCTCPEARANNQKTKKLTQLCAAVGGALLVILIVIGVLTSGKTNPFKSSAISFSGADGYGTVSINEDALIKSVIGEEPSTLSEKSLEWAEKYAELSNGIEYQIENNKNLSNGDKVSITFTFTNAAAEVFKSGTETVTVSGLKELAKVDAFKDVEVSFSGISGQGEVTIKNNSTDDFIKTINFYVDEDSNDGEFANGDEIEIVASFSETTAEKYFKIPKENSKAYTVSGLATELTSSEVPKEIIEDIKNYFTKNKQDLIDTEFYTYNDIQYHSTYFYTIKEEKRDASPTPPANKMFVYFTANKHSTRTGALENTVVIELEIDGNYKYNDFNYKFLVKFPDGTTNIVTEEINISTDTDDIETVINDNDGWYFADYYTAEKID